MYRIKKYIKRYINTTFKLLSLSLSSVFDNSDTFSGDELLPFF